MKDDGSLTRDNNRRVWGVNPIIGSDVDNVLGDYVPLGPLQGWRREGFQDSLNKAGGWIVLHSRSVILVGGPRVHLGGEECLNAVCGQGGSISEPTIEFRLASVADHEQPWEMWSALPEKLVGPRF